MPTSATGIVQADVVLKSGIEFALANVRKNPFLLDYCFAWMSQDTLTAPTVGKANADKAKAWFLATDVPVLVLPALLPAEGIAVSVGLVSSSDAELTLGDVHYDPEEPADIEPQVLAGPFAGTYTSSTGAFAVDTNTAASVILTPGMVVYDTAGDPYPVVEVLDDQTLQLATGIVADFSQATLRGAGYITHLESQKDQEVYQVGVHVQGEAEKCLWLHSVVKFCLLLYKQKVLEGRGLERTSIRSANLMLDPGWNVENMFSRYVTVTGYVQQTWPKDILPQITGVVTSVRVSGLGAVARSAQDLLDLPWLGDQDPLPPLFSGSTPPYSNPSAPVGSPLVYFGDSTDPGDYDPTFLQALPGELPATSRKLYLQVATQTPSEFLFVALPASFGTTGTSFLNADTQVEVPFTRVAYNVVVPTPGSAGSFNLAYDVWKSNAPGLGALTLQVR